MWVTQNYTPFAVGGTFVCDLDGRKTWVVAVRATFTISPQGQLVRAPEQPEVSRAPKFVGDPASSSLLFDSDFPLTKGATDVILRAQAFAPGGRPAPVVDVGFQIGPLRKLLRVYGERVWTRAGSSRLAPSRPKPFLALPITYERAFGGSDPHGQEWFRLNPLGRGYAKQPEQLLHTLMPNVEDPREPLDSATRIPRTVAGFGALPSHWPQRAHYAGTYDERWKLERAPLWPEDFDPRFFQIAPQDQQVAGFLRGGESCFLWNLTPSGSLRFTLPKLRIQVTTLFSDREETRAAQLHTVLVDTEEQLLTMIWHTALECHDREQLLQRSLIRWEGERTWAEAPRSTSMV